MPRATLTTKGQITVPIQVRKALGLKPGIQIDFYEVEDGEYAIRARTASIRTMAGCIPKLASAPTLDEMDRAVLDGVADEYLAGLNEVGEPKCEIA